MATGKLWGCGMCEVEIAKSGNTCFRTSATAFVCVFRLISAAVVAVIYVTSGSEGRGTI